MVATATLPRDGGMAEDHGAPEAGDFSESGPESCRRKEFVARQCRMRREVSWNGWPLTLHEVFSIVPILER